MKILIAFVFLIGLFFIIQPIGEWEENQNFYPDNRTLNRTLDNKLSYENVSLYPVEYDNETYKIIIAKDPQRLIQPYSNATNIFVDMADLVKNESSGDLEMVYKNGKSVEFIYSTDDATLCNDIEEKGGGYYRYGKIIDVWMPPDYYLLNNLRGDCEDFSIFMAGFFEREEIPYMIVGGKTSTGMHWWVEFIFQEEKFFADINKNEAIFVPMERNIYEGMVMFNKSTPDQKYDLKWWNNST